MREDRNTQKNVFLNLNIGEGFKETHGGSINLLAILYTAPHPSYCIPELLPDEAALRKEISMSCVLRIRCSSSGFMMRSSDVDGSNDLGPFVIETCEIGAKFAFCLLCL